MPGQYQETSCQVSTRRRRVRLVPGDVVSGQYQETPCQVSTRRCRVRLVPGDAVSGQYQEISCHVSIRRRRVRLVSGDAVSGQYQETPCEISRYQDTSCHVSTGVCVICGGVGSVDLLQMKKEARWRLWGHYQVLNIYLQTASGLQVCPTPTNSRIQWVSSTQ